MDGKIKMGKLMVKRNGEYKIQYCPFKPYEKECGEYCPHLDISGEYIKLTCSNGNPVIICDSEVK